MKWISAIATRMKLQGLRKIPNIAKERNIAHGLIGNPYNAEGASQQNSSAKLESP